ncbi:MAG: single-stranded DNA-binding protein [Spirochaetaceae bacterium]|nr:single-stranded DNA-binding protein [Spirochaetaceae bacterium]
MSKYDDLNSVLLEGRLTRDPNLRTFTSDSKVCNFSIANNYSYKLKDGSYKSEANFIDIQVWGNSGALCMQYLTKGSIVRLRGSLKQNKWEDKEGKKNSKIIVNAEHVEFRQIMPKAESKIEECSVVKGTDAIKQKNAIKKLPYINEEPSTSALINTIDNNSYQ